jgi:hypothetical protein
VRRAITRLCVSLTALVPFAPPLAAEPTDAYAVAAWKQRRWGEAQYQREIAASTERWARAREAGWDRPLTFAGAYPDLRTRRAIQYSKGMLFFVELRRACRRARRSDTLFP